MSIQIVRSAIVDLLASHAGPTDEPISETILIRDGLYCGRRFESGDWSAVWFIEEGEVKLYDPECRPRASLTVSELRPRSQAA